MEGILLNIGIVGIEKYISVGQIIRTGLDITNNVYLKVKELSDKKTSIEIYTLIEELNLECMIMTVKSILHDNKTQDTKTIVDNKEVFARTGSSTSAIDEYVMIDEEIDVTKLLSKYSEGNNHSPKDVILCYFYESILKIDKILNNITKKDQIYHSQYLKLWNIDYTKEFKQLRIWSKQLKERIYLYGIINK
jgi:hypothetical protein